VDNSENKIGNAFLGTGWSFPVTFSAGNHRLNITSNAANINESINIILNTRKGERTLEPNFGSGLQQFMFRKIDNTLKGEIIETIQFSLLLFNRFIKWPDRSINNLRLFTNKYQTQLCLSFSFE
jgi:hypothetical protein